MRRVTDVEEAPVGTASPEWRALYHGLGAGALLSKPEKDDTTLVAACG